MTTIEGASAPPAQSTGGGFYIPTLDGFRTIAVGIVFVSHLPLSQLSPVPGGFGVTVFFVLSGYLITTLLQRERESTGTVSYRDFMIRRALRILPPLYIALTLGLLLHVGGIVDAPNGLAGTWSQLLHFANFYVASGGDAILDGTEVTWSLAVEEHFYLVYPLAFVLLLRWGGVRRAVGVLVGVCVVVLAWRLVYAGGSVDDAKFFELAYRTDMRIDSILWGCVLALAANPLKRAATNNRRDFALIAVIGVALLMTIYPQSNWYKGTIRFTLQPILLAATYYLVVSNPKLLVHRLLDSAPMRYLGRLSYTLYLTSQYLTSHVITIVCFREIAGVGWREDVSLFGDAGTGNLIAATVASVVLSIVVAALMERLVEQPIARLRRRWRHDRVEQPTIDSVEAVISG